MIAAYCNSSFRDRYNLSLDLEYLVLTFRVSGPTGRAQLRLSGEVGVELLLGSILKLSPNLFHVLATAYMAD